MIDVIFEVQPHPNTKQTYLDTAASLRPHLVRIDGFISIERFQSLTDPDKILSLSFFRHEQSVAQWRRLEEHCNAQASGRSGIFQNYRLRIAAVVRDYGLNDRGEAPDDSRCIHMAELQRLKWIGILGGTEWPSTVHDYAELCGAARRSTRGRWNKNTHHTGNVHRVSRHKACRLLA